jgi:hypothetical protein
VAQQYGIPDTSSSILVNKPVVPASTTRLRLISPCPVCVTSGAASTLLFHVQRLSAEGCTVGGQGQQQQQQQADDVLDEQQQVDQGVGVGRVRVVAHMQGRMLVDEDMALEDIIRCGQVLATRVHVSLPCRLWRMGPAPVKTNTCNVA